MFHYFFSHINSSPPSSPVDSLLTLLWTNLVNFVNVTIESGKSSCSLFIFAAFFFFIFLNICVHSFLLLLWLLLN